MTKPTEWLAPHVMALLHCGSVASASVSAPHFYLQNYTHLQEVMTASWWPAVLSELRLNNAAAG